MLYEVITDDLPFTYFLHPVRFAYVDLENGTHATVDASYRMTIKRPNHEATPYKTVATEKIDGIERNNFV